MEDDHCHAEPSISSLQAFWWDRRLCEMNLGFEFKHYVAKTDTFAKEGSAVTISTT